MQPFVRDASDLVKVRETLDRFGANVKVYAKIESESGWENLESLFPVCDEIVIARGDLANAVGLDWIPIVQHDIERRCKTAGKPYMVVTQMLDSMIERPVRRVRKSTMSFTRCTWRLLDHVDGRSRQ